MYDHESTSSFDLFVALAFFRHFYFTRKTTILTARMKVLFCFPYSISTSSRFDGLHDHAQERGIIYSELMHF